MKIEPASARFAHRGCRSKQALQRRRAESYHHTGLDEFDLLLEPGQTRAHFLGRRFTVAGGAEGHVRTALEDVCNIDILALETHRLDDLGEKLASTTHKRFAQGILVCPRSLPHKQELGVGIANAEDDLGPGPDEMGTFDANKRSLSQSLECPRRWFLRTLADRRLDFLDITVSNLERLEQCTRRYWVRTKVLTDSFQDGKGL